MPRLRNRKGVFVVIVGMLFVALIGASAMAIDMSRIWAMRNELQTSADAGALAGAIQLTPPKDDAYTVDSATAWARNNKVFHDTVSVDSVQLGVWDDTLATFTNGATPPNAVHVVVSHNTTNLIIAMMGVPSPRVKARATAWANAPVTETSCIKPWSVPYVVLMYRLNLARNITPANSAANLTRPFDQALDVPALNAMTEAQRTFSLKMGSGTVNDPVPGATMPGNFQAVQLPRYWDAETDTYNPDGSADPGADGYRNNVSGQNCNTLSVGDSLEVKTGNMTGPTIQGVTATGPAAGAPGICDVLVGEDTNTPRNDPTFGDCLDGEGNNGVKVKAAFHLCRTGCNGSTKVSVEMLGSFTLKKIYPQGSTGKQTPSFDKAEIVGTFDPIEDTGPIGTGSSTLRRLILVQ